MTNLEDEMIPTKVTLIGRLRNWKDQSSWQEFFDTYFKLIYGVARKAGLTEAEAQDVLQATMVSVAGHIPTFKYDPKIGSFKDWLQNLTRLEIISLSLKRHSSSGEAGKETLAVEADHTGQTLEQIWEAEWKINLMNSATANVKRRQHPQKFQIYDFCVHKEWPPEKVAASFGVSLDEVRVATDSVTEMIQAEFKRLEQEML